MGCDTPVSRRAADRPERFAIVPELDHRSLMQSSSGMSGRMIGGNSLALRWMGGQHDSVTCEPYDSIKASWGIPFLGEEVRSRKVTLYLVKDWSCSVGSYQARILIDDTSGELLVAHLFRELLSDVWPLGDGKYSEGQIASVSDERWDGFVPFGEGPCQTVAAVLESAAARSCFYRDATQIYLFRVFVSHTGYPPVRRTPAWVLAYRGILVNDEMIDMPKARGNKPPKWLTRARASDVPFTTKFDDTIEAWWKNQINHMRVTLTDDPLAGGWGHNKPLSIRYRGEPFPEIWP